MKSERQPLLSQAEPSNVDETNHDTKMPRPDLRNSPENALIDVQNDSNDGT
jgi:hypothetical protein